MDWIRSEDGPVESFPDDGSATPILTTARKLCTAEGRRRILEMFGIVFCDVLHIDMYVFFGPVETDTLPCMRLYRSVLSHITSVLVGRERQNSFGLPILFGIDAANWPPELHRLVMRIFCEISARYSALMRLSDRGNSSDWWCRQAKFVCCFVADYQREIQWLMMQSIRNVGFVLYILNDAGRWNLWGVRNWNVCCICWSA